MKTTAAFLLSLFVTNLVMAQGRVYVMEGATGDGTSWAKATGDLAGKMAAAVTGTEIWVAQGSYTPATCMGTCDETDRKMSFRLRRGVSVTGGFVGGETDVDQAAADNVTVLSGDIGTAGDPSDNSFNVVYCDGCGADAAMSKLTISGGNAARANRNITQRGRAGAGLYLDASDGRVASPTLTAVSVVNNDSWGQGGGIYLNGFKDGDASPAFVDCLIAFNTSRADGGAVYVLGSEGKASPRFTGTVIRNNGTVNPGTSSGQSGGALYITANDGTAEVVLERCLLTRNAADISTPGFNNGNSSANGGAAYLAASPASAKLSLTIRNSVLSHNSAYSGGAIYDNRGNVRFTNVSMVANQALGSGGSGAGLYINGGTATVANSLSYGNRVPNNPGAGQDLRFVNGTLDVSYSLFEANDKTEAFSCSNPSCANDGFNEGTGILYGRDPMFVDMAADVPQLQATSPALDAGDNGHAATGGGDYFGAERVANGTVDLGAVERNASPLPVELTGFGASPTGQGAIKIAWTSLSEVDLGSYQILRSETGEPGDFTQVGQTVAMGSGEYAHFDRAVIPGEKYYYRLRSVDLDGTTYDSEVAIASIQGGTEEAALFSDVYPNPTTGEVRVELSPRPNARTVYATLFDATGRKLALWPLTTDGTHVLSLRDFADGQYVLRLVEGGRQQSTTLLVHY